jgi:F-type H+-transporting ATPase subunit beta
MVALDEAISGFERILNDELSEYPEKSLYMIGNIEEAVKE